MITEQERVFEENPYTIGIFVTVFMACFWFVMILILANVGQPAAHGKFARMGITTTSGVAVFLFLVFSFVLAIVWVMLSVMPRLTIVCGSSDFTVFSRTFWRSSETMRTFEWKDVSGMEVKTGAKGAKSFVVAVNGEELVLMNRTIFNAGEFKEIERVFEEEVRKSANPADKSHLD
ncbi:MAG: hypothetical protein IPN69_19110 [Acidobacteria bacterium]|nr:hypothetical protein [Acidobacteriota bacterium]MBK8150968.1 hypothetical protein [Acidobacteriota bacterium]MBK8812820.1 hypothetical protein [Acidobacteriota bacterium]